MEAAGRAPGDMVSETGRVALGINLERLHPRLQAGGSRPALEHGSRHSAWISLLARPGQRILDPPETRCGLALTPVPAVPGHSGRYVAMTALLTHEDPDVVVNDAKPGKRIPGWSTNSETFERRARSLALNVVSSA